MRGSGGEAAVVAESGGVIGEIVRSRCNGAGALTTFQGLLCDEIVLRQSAMEAPEPEALVRAADDFAQWMQNEALYLPGEFAVEALFSYYVHDYVAQARHSGHAHYVALRGNDQVALKSAAAGLKSMLADPHLAVFNAAIQLATLGPKPLRKLLRQRRWRNAAAGFAALDAELASLEAREPLTPRQRAWLRSLRKVRTAPDAELANAWQALAAANPLRERRRIERDRLQAEREKDDPLYRALRALCDMAGLRFERVEAPLAAPMRSIWPEGPDRRALIYRIETDRGRRVAAFYREGALFKRHLAVLMEEGGALPLGSLSLSRAEYAAIAPEPKRRR